ncbi:MAG: TerB family tellurite resistance protein [Aquincola sp.]|nr:TerB family tellurite resistance protein [Aquincola sp.]MDH5329728.1 TerB family tellurite resistance protein [Aquincola sp.]
MEDHDICSDAGARLLAMVVSADGRVDARELQALDLLDAFSRIGISRHRFATLARRRIEDFGAGLSQRGWLRITEQVQIDRLAGSIDDPQQRILLARMAAAVITADGAVSRVERRVYEHLLDCWQLGSTAVTQAILHDAPRSPEVDAWPASA